MFSSQLSATTSKTSISSTDTVDLFDSHQLPEKYRENCVLARKIFVNNAESDYVDLLITDNLELVECQQGEVVNYLNLSDEIDSNRRKVEVVLFHVVFTDDDDRVIYAIKFNTTLIGVERRTSQLKVVGREKNVASVRKHFCNKKREIGFLVTFNDNREKFTKFLDEEHESFVNNENFHEIYKSVKCKKEAVESMLAEVSQEIAVLQQKQTADVPKSLLSDVSAPQCKFQSPIQPHPHPCTFRIQTRSRHCCATAAYGPGA